MSDGQNSHSDAYYIESSGLPQLIGVFGIAGQPAKIGLGLAAIVFTIFWGIVLDGIWSAAGQGISTRELNLYVANDDTPETGEATGGVFSVFSAFEISCVRDAIESVRYGRFIGDISAGEPSGILGDRPGGHQVRGALTNLVLMGRGLSWLITRHYVYALLFIPAAVLIWGLFGGAVCRMTAVQFAGEELVGVADALRFSRKHLFDGFFAAPLLPLVLVLMIGLVLIAGGVLLSIPWVGDLIGGVFFFLALLGGLVISLLIVGLMAGGSLFWPTIAVEASDSFDAVARSYSYVYARPLRTIWYATWLALFGSFAWLLVMFVIWLAAGATHLFVSLGSGVFGDFGAAGDKLSVLWAPPTFEILHRLPGQLEGIRYASGGLIAMWVLLMWAAAWSFLSSFYLSGSTVAYFLLRRDVDGTDLGEVVIDDSNSSTGVAVAEKAENSEATKAAASSSAPDPATESDNPTSGS